MSDAQLYAPEGGALRLAWTRVPRTTVATIVKQIDEDGCGPACGEMLLRDRGFSVDQTVIRDGLPLPVDGPRLAARLTTLTPIRWLGGALAIADDVAAEHVYALSQSRGSWAALLEPHGLRHVGHWVVIDGLSSDGLVIVRDPDGDSYSIPVEEFLALWRYTVLVIEEVA